MLRIWWMTCSGLCIEINLFGEPTKYTREKVEYYNTDFLIGKWNEERNYETYTWEFFGDGKLIIEGDEYFDFSILNNNVLSLDDGYNYIHIKIIELSEDSMVLLDLYDDCWPIIRSDDCVAYFNR